MKFEKSCGAIVLDENKVLVVTHQAGHTDFPKGHMEGNEIEEETAIREVKEETNIDIELLPYSTRSKKRSRLLCRQKKRGRDFPTTRRSIFCPMDSYRRG